MSDWWIIGLNPKTWPGRCLELLTHALFGGNRETHITAIHDRQSARMINCYALKIVWVVMMPASFFVFLCAFLPSLVAYKFPRAERERLIWVPKAPAAVDMRSVSKHRGPKQCESIFS